MASITKPKRAGGWGLLDMRTFGKSLLSKSLYRGIFDDRPWSKIVKTKYIKGKSIEFWCKRRSIGIRSRSVIWQSFRKVHPYFMKNLRWNLYSGSNIFIAFDSISSAQKFSFPHPLICNLHRLGCFTWDKLIKDWSGSSSVWNDGEDLHLPQSMLPLWFLVKERLGSLGITRSGSKDRLVWSLQKPVSLKHIYADMISVIAGSPLPHFPPYLWKAACPLKMIIFSWLLFWNKSLTWEVLQRRSWQGPNRCSMCLNDLESNLHMFFQCPSSLYIWYDLPLYFDFPYNIFSSVHKGFIWWSR